MAESKYRRQASGACRVRRGALRYTDAEYAVITMVAAIDGMRPGAWAQQAAYTAALRRHNGDQPEPEVVAELVAVLRQHRRVLANIGGNINQLARTANSTGELPAQQHLEGVLRVVRRQLEISDSLLARAVAGGR